MIDSRGVIVVGLGAGVKTSAMVLVGSLRQLADERCEMFEISRMERDLQSVIDGSDHAIKSIDIMAETEPQ